MMAILPSLHQSQHMSKPTQDSDALLDYNARISRMRATEYPMIHGTTYLDHAGTTIPSASLITSFAQTLQSTLLANPHSSSLSSPNTAHRLVDQTRVRVLELFHADPEHFEVVFVANASAGIRLVADAFSCQEHGFEYLYHRDSHTSLIGVRELAKQSHCLQSDSEAEEWIKKTTPDDSNKQSSTLFAYPAQSNLNGRRLPQHWSKDTRENTHHKNVYTLLDVAALVTTSPLDLSNHETAPDFTILSFYKIYGFPDLGALIVRKSSVHTLSSRRYFGGGTTGMVICSSEPFVALKPRICDRLEDGTLPIRNILALSCALDVHQRLFGGFRQISRHTGWLAKVLHDHLITLKHASGVAVCQMYTDPASKYGDPATQGATIAFNVRNSEGAFISSSAVGNLARKNNILLRAGSMCNPGGTSHVLGFHPQQMREAYDVGFRCGQEDDIMNGMPTGLVRVSFGAMSTMDDVEVFIKFVQECFVIGGSADEDVKERSSTQTDVLSREKDVLQPVNRRRRLPRFWRSLRACWPHRGAVRV